MRRMLFAIAALTATTAFAFNSGIRPVRVVFLAQAEHDDAFRGQLERELHDLGYEVSETPGTINDLGRDRVAADYYIEILGAGGNSRPIADAGAGPVGVTVSRNHFASSVNIYDGRTLDLVQAVDVHKRDTNISSADLYVGGRPVWAAITLPIFEWSQYRNAMRRLAHDTARNIDKALRR